jgi:glycosyltransferase involved in cell wall biosynthesis
MYTVWLPRIGYPERRNIACLPFERHRCVRRRDSIGLVTGLYYRLSGSNHDLLLNSYHCNRHSRDGVVHLFNGICFGSAPWVSTFESCLPRWHGVSSRLLRIGYEAMARPTCLGLVAISEASAKIHREQLRRVAPELEERIAGKLHVIHPPQSLPADTRCREDVHDRPVRFVMVGRLFFTKGGRSLLSAFKSLYLSGRRDWTLDIVSTLEIGDEESGSTELDRARALSDIASMAPLVRHCKSLTSDGVASLFQRSHVALLPTLADTYGYVVLEAQAAGCPVITTDVRALTEINDAACGWVIPIPKNHLGIGAWRSARDLTKVEDKLSRDLELVLLGILGQRNSIGIRSQASIERIRSSHDPHRVAKRIEEIYMRRFSD